MFSFQGSRRFVKFHCFSKSLGVFSFEPTPLIMYVYKELLDI